MREVDGSVTRGVRSEFRYSSDCTDIGDLGARFNRVGKKTRHRIHTIAINQSGFLGYAEGPGKRDAPRILGKRQKGSTHAWGSLCSQYRAISPDPRACCDRTASMHHALLSNIYHFDIHLDLHTHPLTSHAWWLVGEREGGKYNWSRLLRRDLMCAFLPCPLSQSTHLTPTSISPFSSPVHTTGNVKRDALYIWCHLWSYSA